MHVFVLCLNYTIVTLRFKDNIISLDDFKEELIDTLLVNLDLIYKVGMTDSEMENIAQKKINKWIEKQNM